MKNKKILITALVALLIIAGGFVGLQSLGKSTQDSLQSQTWTWNADKSDGIDTTVKFTDNKMRMTGLGLSLVYSYKVNKAGNSEEINFTNKNSVTGSNETRVFSIKKIKGEYKLTAKNNLAKKDTGDVTLIPKK
ncbi:hypothetical protein [Leuconostoc mesenteroides]|uniref:hypothetical protein n=1 Tax=Leuconostoc mesenteroides TaxID=1245 RepID=UPI002360E090|nr:hypothetical protein [Leuconostoc mesenteroides]